MRRAVLASSVSVLIALLPSVALAHSVAWVHEFGSSEYDVAWGIVSLGTDVYVDGWTYGTLPDQTNLGSWDGFLRKIDASGNEVWTVTLGTPKGDFAVALGVDATGLYVAGGTDGRFPGEAKVGSTDGFLQKYDVDGNLLWTAQFGTDQFDEISNVVVDATGIYVAGSTYGTFPGRSNRGDADVFLARFELDGTMAWVREFGSRGYDSGYANALGPAGVFVNGWTEGRLPGQERRGKLDAFAGLYSTDGGRVWLRQFGTRRDDLCYGIVADAIGVYVSGETRGTLKGQTSAGGTDAYVRKLSATSGSTIWTHQFGTDALDTALGLGAVGDQVYAVGATGGALGGDLAGSGDAFAVALDTLTGTETWTLQLGTAESDEAHWAWPTNGSLAIAGATRGAFEGEVNAGDQDAFVALLELTP